MVAKTKLSQTLLDMLKSKSRSPKRAGKKSRSPKRAGKKSRSPKRAGKKSRSPRRSPLKNRKLTVIVVSKKGKKTSMKKM